ncbi:hypothetical protein PtA15_12A350 [Puccinia triticina]|uniref:Uncharacterized protein n=1 Tax=Puccinia triticina TaxID=208348 RepID=A0ABY7CYT4_9BASI|nr:uncharacterized protein PtA15_12A350 [Puccinia triticina]WAQ90361.1 hypothetical protein PtA15_12A350 [Puccinia triticina]
MIPQPNRDQALLRSFLGNLSRSCYWSSFIRPLIFLILTYQLRHHYPTAQSSAKKLLDQLQLPHPPIPPPKWGRVGALSRRTSSAGATLAPLGLSDAPCHEPGRHRDAPIWHPYAA